MTALVKVILVTDKPHHPLNVDGELRAFFGRRSGKRLHKGQDRLFKELLPVLEIALPEGALDPAGLFPGKSDVIIEIGYGGGEHLAGLTGVAADDDLLGRKHADRSTADGDRHLGGECLVGRTTHTVGAETDGHCAP